MKENKNGEWLQDIIGEIDDALLLEAEELRKSSFSDQYHKMEADAATKSKKKEETISKYLNAQEKEEIISKYSTAQEKEETISKYSTIQERQMHHVEVGSEKITEREKTILQGRVTEREQTEIEDKSIKTGQTERKWTWKKMGTIAACISVFFISGFFWENGFFHKNTKDLVQNDMTTEVEQDKEQNKEREEESNINEEERMDTFDMQESISDTSGMQQSPTDSIGTAEDPEEMQIAGANTQGKSPQETESASSGEMDTERQNSSVSNAGVYIPQREVTLGNTEDVAYCMLGFFIYQGKVYMEYEWLENAEALVGKRLGTATGLIDAWTTKDGYVELAGSVAGDFYEVKGYEPEFMLCMKMGDGKIWIFIHDNDLKLDTGADIFETYLHLSEKSYTASYMTNEEWNSGLEKTPVSADGYDDVKALLNAINKGTFVLTEELWKDCGTHVFYTEKQLYHLYLELEDGMVIHLRIFEGGYVMFDGVKQVCVKVEM